MRFATSADKLSLSPILISSVATTSFSLMIGTTCRSSSARSVFLRVQIALAIGQIGPREQGLGNDQIFFREEVVPHLHQPGLSDRGQHLLERNIFARCARRKGPDGPRRWHPTRRAPPGGRPGRASRSAAPRPSIAGRARRSSPPVSVFVPTLTTRRFFVRSPIFAGLILYRAIIGALFTDASVLQVPPFWNRPEPLKETACASF